VYDIRRVQYEKQWAQYGPLGHAKLNSDFHSVWAAADFWARRSRRRQRRLALRQSSSNQGSDGRFLRV